jgi:hypothetical protein
MLNSTKHPAHCAGFFIQKANCMAGKILKISFPDHRRAADKLQWLQPIFSVLKPSSERQVVTI